MNAELLALLGDHAAPLAFLLAGILILAKFGHAVPARRGFIALVLPLPLLALGFFVAPLKGLFWCYTPVLTVLMLVDAFALSVAPDRLDVRRELPARFFIGQENRVRLVVRNPDATRAVTGMLADGSPAGFALKDEDAGLSLPVQLKPGEELVFERVLVPGDRGRFEYGALSLRILSRLQLLWLTREAAPPESVRVLPDWLRVRRMQVRFSRSLNQGELRRRSLGVEGTRLSGLRNYSPGDDPRRLAWQTTAKLDTPIVRTFEPEVEQPVMILLDAGRRMTARLPDADTHPEAEAESGAESPAGLRKFDRAVNAALSFAAVAMDRGDRVGLGVFNNRILQHLPPGAGAAHFRKLQTQLADSAAEAVEPRYETSLLHFAKGLKRRSLIILITDLMDPAASRDLLAGLKAFSRQHLVLLASFSDPAIQAMAGAMPTTPQEAYSRGAAADLLMMRARTMGALSRHPATIVIDAEPDALDEALIRRYMRIKVTSSL